MTSWIYCIAADGSDEVKIGYAKNPQLRLANLQTGRTDRLQLMDKVPGDMEGERALHEALLSLKVRREWFRDREVIRHLFDMLRERLLDRAEVEMQKRWRDLTLTADEGLDEFYRRESVTAEDAAEEARHALVYFDYGRRTDDWNLEDLPNVPPELMAEAVEVYELSKAQPSTEGIG